MYLSTQHSTASAKETPYLKAESARRGIHIAAHNPSAAEIIPLVEQRIADHQNHFAKTMDPNGGYYTEWKTVHDDLTNFLEELRRRSGVPQRSPQPEQPASTPNAEESSPTADDSGFFPENTGQNTQPIPNQHNSNWPDTGQTLANTGQSLPNTGQNRPDSGQSQPNPGQSPPPPLENQNSHPGDDDGIDDPPDETAAFDSDPDQLQNEDQDEDEDEEDPAELDFEAELSGFNNYAELMAEAAADLQAALNKRNRFDALKPEAQAAIIELLDKYKSRFVAKLLVKPPPIGMSFKISKSGLNDFAKRYRRREEQRRANENAKASADLLDKSDDPDKAFQHAIERLLRLRALTTASDPNAPLDAVEGVVNVLTKLRKQTLAERKQLHAEKLK